MALAVAVVMTSAVASALIGSLKAEQVARYAMDTEFAAGQVLTRSYLGLPAAELGPSWAVSTTEEYVEIGQMRTRWAVSKIRLEERPAAQATVMIRFNGPWRAE